MTSSDWRSQIFEKKIVSPNLGPMGQNQVQNLVFCHFLKFGSLIFLEITDNDSLQQWLTSSRDKIYKTNSCEQNEEQYALYYYLTLFLTDLQ